jgi:hypothetical protein
MRSAIVWWKRLGFRTLALLVKLQQALAKLADDNGCPVCGPLKSFINQVSGLSGKSISVADANYLIMQANQIRAVVGCQ